MWRFSLLNMHCADTLRRFSQGGLGGWVADRHHRRQRRGKSRPRLQHRKDAVVGGGAELSFLPVPTVEVDMRAESQIESFLRQQQQQQQQHHHHHGGGLSSGKRTVPTVRVVNIPGSTLKRAVLDFCVGERRVQAVGQSTRAKKAKALCYMHAVRLVDYFSIDGVDHNSTPLPFEEERPVAGGNAHSRGRNLMRGSSAPPQSEKYGNWGDYVKDCEQYIEQREKTRRAEAYAQLRTPPTGNLLVDRATEMTEQEGSTNRLALQLLNNKVQNATKDINLVRMSQRVFVATFVLDGPTQMIATGVASTAKEAKQRVAMHALNIIKLVMEQRGLSAPQGPMPAGRGSCTSSDAILLSLPPRYAKMLEFLTLLFGVVPNLTFTKERACYTCHLELDGVKCTGSGVNRFEAERTAIENALSEMELYDERLQGINSLIARHPNIQPQCVPTAKLPAVLRDEIRSFVERCCTDLPSLNEGVAVVAGDESGETNMDAETHATIKRLEEATPDKAYACRMRERLCSLRADPAYLNRFHARRLSLSIASVEQRITEALHHHRVVVVCGTTGCGKTTQVPQYILDHEIMAERGDRCCIVVTQPRRLSAFSIAERIASERLDTVGGDVGYAVRLDAKPGRHITLCTSGVLLQMLSSMPSLNAISHLVIDEVHERDINCDVILALVKDLLEKHNTLLKVVLMSATMQSEMFSSYFGNVPVIAVEGAVFPVKERYLEDVANLFQQTSSASYYSPMFDSLDNTGVNQRRKCSNSSSGLWQRKRLSMNPLKTDYNLVARLIGRSVEVDLQNNVLGKSVLVFLPGWKELVATKQAIESLHGGQQYHIILLHSSVDAAKQRECFAPAPSGKVKVVLATNIAESGITIDDAAVVIDTGLIKQTTWGSRVKDVHHERHASSYATHLVLQYASRANCTQRKGRAGRTQGGVCYRLFTRDVWDALPSFQEAEIHRVPLAQVLLKLMSLGHQKPKETLGTFIEPPSESNVTASMRQLQSLGAVTSEECLTPLGLYLSRLPCDPRVGKMIMMGAVLRCLDSVLTMAATGDISPFLASREISFEVRKRRHTFSMGSQSDHISVLNAYNAFCARRGNAGFAQENYLHMNNLRLISRYKQQYRDILRRSGFIRNGEFSCIDFPDEEFVADYGTMSPTLYVDSGALSIDASDVALVKACLCAALSPNLAILDPAPLLHGGKNTKTLVMRTPTHAAISPSKDSACRRLGPPRTHGVLTSKELFGPDGEANAEPYITPSMLYIYQDIFGLKESREEFLTQVSSVSLWALLLFGVGKAEMRFDSQLQLCIVGGWIGIHIDADSFSVISALRATLHACVWKKYKHPDDEENNEALEVLRRLCKAVLKQPPNDKEQHINRLVDTGRIVSPTKLEPLATQQSGSDDAHLPEEEEEEEEEQE